jgi:hypothetical protein
VKVVYKGSEQDTSSAFSPSINVEVRPAPKSIKGAVIVVGPTFEYDGTAKKLNTQDISVVVGGEAVEPDSGFVIKSIRNNVNAGFNTALVDIEGRGAWKDTETGTFTIEKRQLSELDLVIGYSAEYNGEEQPLSVKLNGAFRGMGDVTVTYDPSDTARVDAGSWNATISVTEGQNFTGIDELSLGTPYSIRKAAWAEEYISYEGVPAELAWDGASHAIATPTFKGLGTKYTGTVKVIYERNGDLVTSVVDSGTYTVSLQLSGDKNFLAEEFILGTIVIHEEGWVVGVKEVAREIPVKPVTEQVAIAPAKVVGGEVTVGPNPVAAGSDLTVFWNGGKAVSGKLAVFSSAGKKVAVVPVSGTKKIGVWNTAGAAEGTYLIRGVLSGKDGAKVKVAARVAVTK